MLLMVQKVIRGGICHSIYPYAIDNNKYMKDFDKNKELSCLLYWDLNNWMSNLWMSNVAKSLNK